MSDDAEAVAMKEGWRVRATTDALNVVAGDLGEIRKTGLHEYHLVFWLRQKATSFYKGTHLERLR